MERQNTQSENLEALLAPPLSGAGFELVDVTLQGGVLQVLVDLAADHPLGGRIDLDGVSVATRIVSDELDATDPIDSPYTLEVSSPGLERPLRKPAHFERFVRHTIAVKTVSGTPGNRRIEGVLESADADPEAGIVVSGRAIAYREIDRAHTVFVWGGQPKPTGAKPKGNKAKPAKAARASAATSTTEPTTEDQGVTQ